MTQWYVGMNGRTGLIYPSLYGLLDRRGYQGDEWLRVFEDVRVLEVAALETMRQE